MYWAAKDSHLSLGGTLIYPRRNVAGGDVEYVRGPHYDQARRINSVLQAWGPILMQATSEMVFYAKGKRGDNSVLPRYQSTMIRAINNTGIVANYEFLVGQFKLADGRTAVMFQNQDTTNSLWASVEFQPGVLTTVREISPSTGEEMPLYDESPFHLGIQIGLDTGGARLFVLPPKQ
jgi:hypothetical protein